MKKSLITLILLCNILAVIKAQNFLSKVPSSSSVVIKYSGENFNKNVPMQKIDSYNFIKNNFLKLLQIDTLTSLQNTGINFEQDTYQYISMQDSSMSYVTLLHLKNAQQFLQLVKGVYKAGTATKTEKKNGFEFIAIDAETYIGWNETAAVIVHTTYQNRKNYYDYLYRTDTIVLDTAKTAIVAAPVQADTVRKPVPNITKDKKIPAPSVAVKTTKKPAPKAVAKNKSVVKKLSAKDKELEENNKYRIKDSIENVKRELWEQQQDMFAKKKQQAVAEIIIGNTFTTSVNSIENELSYKKIIDPIAHLSIWLNTESISKQYWNYFYRGTFSLFNNNPNYKTDTTEGFNSAINIYFEKDKMRIDQKTFSANTKLNNMGKEVMNSKQNTALANYVNPDNIGYFSMSINTEAMANYYYTLMKKYISSTPYMSEYADMVDIYIDMLEIMIDEKGIADLMPGNFLFVMHDIKPRLVNYTDYDYDKEFNKTEVKKTKKELSPNFTFVMETKKEGFMQKIANLPLKYAEKEHYNYKDKTGYYELAFDTGKYPINSLYFMVKDGKAIVTTSKDIVDMTLKNTAFTVDADTKNSILNNNYSLKINSKKLLENISTEFSADVNKKINDYLIENLGDIKMESSLKDGMIQGTTTMKITGNHNNSLEFFFNMIDTINNIIEKEKQEKEKSVN